MHKLKQYFKKRHETHMKKNETDAQRTVLEELFNDLYRNRIRIYKINFVRGLLFGAGSALGGTLILALIVWVLSLFVNLPVVGELFQDAQHSIERTTDEATRE